LRRAGARRISSRSSRSTPVVPPERYAAWLDPGVGDARVVAELLRPSVAVPLLVHRVASRVGDVRADGPELVVPVPDPLPPTLDPRGLADDALF
jgi:putative SOS response-associated peptidase YedK